MVSTWTARQALLPTGIGSAQLSADGSILHALTPVDSAAGESSGIALPSIPNLHSHAFQRAIAGHTERRGTSADSFWTWREQMYAASGAITPATLEQTAYDLYQHMRALGYGWVCEFHYVHHQADGTPYADPRELSLCLIRAAARAGIGLTLLPVLYLRGGFDGRPLSPQQQRFGHRDVGHFFELIEGLLPLESARVRIGIALHSLRAVGMADLLQTVQRLDALPGGASRPIHIHVAEQQAEVNDCLQHHRQRPIAWLLANAPVDQRWCLVHATHADPTELTGMARSGAVVGLCPTTEANLGDGLFPLPEFLQQGGRIGIGSDSHICIDPLEELRWLEYGQRLRTQTRNTLQCAHDDGSTAVALWRLVCSSASAVCDAEVGVLRAGGPPPLRLDSDLELADALSQSIFTVPAHPLARPQPWTNRVD